MKYQNTQEFFLDLPETVLLVGNGKIENKGELIDSYEFVIRFNGFIIEGFEKDVGTKIDAISFWRPDPSRINNWPPTNPICKNYEKYKDKVLMFTSHHGKTDTHVLGRAEKTFLFNTDSTPYADRNPVCECRGGANGARNCCFSSGLSLAMNLSIFFGKKVHLVGFDGWKTGHYYANGRMNEGQISSSTNHNPHLERWMLSRIKDVKFLES